MPALSPAQIVSVAGQQLVFQCPPTQLVNPSYLVVFNKSSYELDLMGYLIPAWSIIPFDLSALLGGATTVIMTSILADNASGAGASTVYVQWLASNEKVPDQQAFTADAIAAAVSFSSSQLFSNTLVSGLPIITMPAGQPYLALSFLNTGAGGSSDSENPVTVTVTGQTTGVAYLNVSFRVGHLQSVPMWCMIYNPTDTKLIVAVSGAASGTQMAAAATSQPPGFANPRGAVLSAFASATDAAAKIYGTGSLDNFIKIWGYQLSWATAGGTVVAANLSIENETDGLIIAQVVIQPPAANVGASGAMSDSFDEPLDVFVGPSTDGIKLVVPASFWGGATIFYTEVIS